MEGINAIQVSQLVKGRYQSGRIVLPVKPSQTIYARFKHVVGVHSQSGGLSLSKLRMLDTLIDQLKKMKGEKAYVKDLEGVSQQNLEKLVEQYQKELNRVIQTQSTKAAWEPGMLVDHLA